MSPPSTLLSLDLLRAIRREYALHWHGIHGISHWARVLENGLRVAELNRARRDVVELFAVFHDSQRWDDGSDPDHGQRGAELAGRLRGKVFELDDAGFELLTYACAHHTDGITDSDATIGTCWDADRLDLGRVGIQPSPAFLSTRAAKRLEILMWAHDRSRVDAVPEIVAREWGLI